MRKFKPLISIMVLCASLCAPSMTAKSQTIRDCGTVIDIDGNEYQTIVMGKDCWMRENLRVTRYSDGHEITPAPEAPNNDPENVSRYGRLYTWYSVLNGAEPTEETDGRARGYKVSMVSFPISEWILSGWKTADEPCSLPESS